MKTIFGYRDFRMDTALLLRFSSGARGIIIMWDVLKSKQNRKSLPPFFSTRNGQKKSNKDRKKLIKKINMLSNA